MGSVGRIDATSEGGFDRMDVHFSALPLTAKVSIATSVCQAVIGCAISRLCDIQYLFLFMFMFIDHFYSLTGIYSRLRTPASSPRKRMSVMPANALNLLRLCVMPTPHDVERVKARLLTVETRGKYSILLNIEITRICRMSRCVRVL